MKLFNLALVRQKLCVHAHIPTLFPNKAVKPLLVNNKTLYFFLLLPSVFVFCRVLLHQLFPFLLFFNILLACSSVNMARILLHFKKEKKT